MNSIELIRSEEIAHALSHEYRQYLTGHLQREQPHLQHIDDDIEIGISFYREFTADKPHMHPIATEHSYILQGCLRLRLLDGSNMEYEFHKGDLFVLRPSVGYATKCAPDTKILFIKSPAGNDKTLIEPDRKTEEWLKSWDILKR